MPEDKNIGAVLARASPPHQQQHLNCQHQQHRWLTTKPPCSPTTLGVRSAVLVLCHVVLHACWFVSWFVTRKRLPSQLGVCCTCKGYIISHKIKIMDHSAAALTDIFLLELSRHVSLHESSLPYSTVSDEDKLELGHFLRLFSFVARGRGAGP